jgi:Tfp pilus assembly protein PilO
MRGRNAYQLWMGGGAAAAVALLAMGWFFLIGPQRGETNTARAETKATHERVDGLRQRLVQLEEQRKDLPEYEARLMRDRAALPGTSGTPDFLRELQQAGNATGVTVSGTTIADPVEVPSSTEQVYALPISLTASGTAAGLDKFLDQLQRVQPRAVLISGVDVASNDAGEGSTNEQLSLNLTLKAFVAPALSGKTIVDGD